MAPLVACHGIHSSSAPLASTLRIWNPLVVCLENGVQPIPILQAKKHSSEKIRVFIGNQNRRSEHTELVDPLKRWLHENPKIIAVIVGDRTLAETIGIKKQVEFFPLLPYHEYRNKLRKCHIALLPLQKGEPERCKTVIKWAEASAESVAVVAGPELYTSISKNKHGEATCSIGRDAQEIVEKAKRLVAEKEERLRQIVRAHEWVVEDWNLNNLVIERLNLYLSLWKRREKIDDLLIKRLHHQAKLLMEEPFLA